MHNRFPHRIRENLVSIVKNPNSPSWVLAGTTIILAYFTFGLWDAAIKQYSLTVRADSTTMQAISVAKISALAAMRADTLNDSALAIAKQSVLLTKRSVDLAEANAKMEMRAYLSIEKIT